MPPKKNSPLVAAADKSTVVSQPDVVVEKEEVLVVDSGVVEEPDKFVVILDKLQAFINDAKEMSNLVKVLQKDYVKLQKLTTKKTKKSSGTGEGSKRLPSGFAKPTRLSDELCDFLDVEHGSSMARTMVTKHINEYIKKNNLQDATDKRQIIPDAKLKSILSVKDGDKLTYFNLQTFIKQHFMKE